MTLQITPLENAIARLAEGLARYERDRSDDQIRDGLIQRFEFTYEQAHKTLKRYLEWSAASPQDFDALSFADLIRSGNEAGLLLHDWPVWRGYRDMRAKTSHTYDEAIALEVVAGIPAFLADATHLRDELRRRLA
jgi:nucleotidyltransferase substrate binding protein (TIGR01987 family)